MAAFCTAIRLHRGILAVVLVLQLIIVADRIDAASYNTIDLGTLGGTESRAYGLSSSGLVTGSSVTANGKTHAFIYDGTMTDINGSGGVYSIGYGINDSRIVTGQAQNAPPNSYAFLYDGSLTSIATGNAEAFGSAINNDGHIAGYASPGNAFLYAGAIQDLGTLGGSYSLAYGINSAGMVTGRSLITANQGSHAFLYDGAMHDLGSLGGSYSEGRSINSSGHVAGFSSLVNDSPLHAFLFDGAMHDLGTLGGTESLGFGINASNIVVGSSYLAGNAAQHAFLFDGAMHDLNSLIDPSAGWVLTEARAINDRGQIVGYGVIGGHTHAFLMTPVPEPSALILACAAAIMFVSVTYLRRRIGPTSFDVDAFNHG